MNMNTNKAVQHDNSGCLSLVEKLNNPPSDLKFYESGSRAVAKRIGSDKITQADLDRYQTDPLRYVLAGSDKRMKDKDDTLYWLGRKPIIISEETDYDFYCKHDEKHVAFLQKLGFVSTWYSVDDRSDIDYRDQLCDAVFVHEDHPIQVVTRSDPLLYKAIFDNIPHDMYYDFLWKSSPVTPDRDNIRRWFDTFAIIAKAVQELK